jgi:hypothetical protein
MQQYTDAAGKTRTRFAQHTGKVANRPGQSIMKDIGTPGTMKVFSQAHRF